MGFDVTLRLTLHSSALYFSHFSVCLIFPISIFLQTSNGFTTPETQRRSTASVDPPTPGRRDGTDKIVDMLSVAFIDEAQAAGRVNPVPIHKLGIKFTLPEAYEGRPDHTTFENWLFLLLGFFRIHQLDILNEVQDRARLEILGQASKDRAQTYFRERHQMFLEQGSVGLSGGHIGSS